MFRSCALRPFQFYCAEGRVHCVRQQRCHLQHNLQGHPGLNARQAQGGGVDLRCSASTPCTQPHIRQHRPRACGRMGPGTANPKRVWARSKNGAWPPLNDLPSGPPPREIFASIAKQAGICGSGRCMGLGCAPSEWASWCKSRQSRLTHAWSACHPAGHGSTAIRRL